MPDSSVCALFASFGVRAGVGRNEGFFFLSARSAANVAGPLDPQD